MFNSRKIGKMVLLEKWLDYRYYKQESLFLIICFIYIKLQEHSCNKWSENVLTRDYNLMIVFVSLLILGLVIVICNGAVITPDFN